MDKVGKLLPGVLARQPNAGRLIEVRVRIAFGEVIGETLAASCEAIEVRGSILSITTSNPALAHQLRLDSERLLERLNGSGLGRRMRSIRIRTGRGRGSGNRW